MNSPCNPALAGQGITSARDTRRRVRIHMNSDLSRIQGNSNSSRAASSGEFELNVIVGG